MIALSWLNAVPAFAQQVTVFSEDFESYTSGSNLPTGGTTDLWASRTAGGNKETVEQGSASQFLYLRGGGGVQVTTVTISASGLTGTLTFDLRYTGNNGDSTTDNPSDNGFTFNEFDTSADDLMVEYTVDGTTFSTLQSFAYNTTTYASGFSTVTITLPSAALVSSLQIRFNQPSGGGTSVDQWAIDNVIVTVTTPEPAAVLSFGLGGAALGFAAWRNRRKKSRQPAQA